MSAWLQLLLVFAAAVNPAAVARGWWSAQPGPGPAPAPAAAVLVIGVATAGALLLAAALVADSLLGWLDISPETFRIAAGAVMVTAGVFAIWRGRAGGEEAPGGWLAGVFPLGLPLLASPAAVIAALSYGADEGALKAWSAAGVAVVAGALAALLPAARMRTAADAVARLTGALLVALAARLIVEGVQDV